MPCCQLRSMWPSGRLKSTLPWSHGRSLRGTPSLDSPSPNRYLSVCFERVRSLDTVRGFQTVRSHWEKDEAKKLLALTICIQWIYALWHGDFDHLSTQSTAQSSTKIKNAGYLFSLLGVLFIYLTCFHVSCLWIVSIHFLYGMKVLQMILVDFKGRVQYFIKLSITVFFSEVMTWLLMIIHRLFYEHYRPHFC